MSYSIALTLGKTEIPVRCEFRADGEVSSLLHSKVIGGCCGSTKKRTIVGGWAWAWWLVTDVQRLSLEVMTLNPMCEMVETAQGVPLTVTGVAQCKIMKIKYDKMMNVYYFHHQADELLGTASEQFLGKSVKEIKMTILQTLEGHLRAILDINSLRPAACRGHLRLPSETENALVIVLHPELGIGIREDKEHDSVVKWYCVRTERINPEITESTLLMVRVANERALTEGLLAPAGAGLVAKMLNKIHLLEEEPTFPW
ncbi:flotillin-2 [Culex quinquefasciatus]|uniref:Flotillin-2 n=1 Tax=Culex quinquefasciatus TaxID=7176 RepID=B0WJH2_CULQU|nr:flotillin-2 [Culex quinquefasciatus]|eukprot:XP_001848856.1 flotillin-2 [Culex quinquefasciatus]